MGYCKSLLFITTFALLCSGIFGHRFQRHLKTVSPTAAASVENVKLNNFKPPPSASTSDSSNTLWFFIGVVSGILGIALLIGLGCLIYHHCIKSANDDVIKIQITTETKTVKEAQTPIAKQEPEKEKEKEKAVEEGKKSGIQEKVTTTKEETEEPKPKKEASKQKSKKQKKKESKKEKKVALPPTPKAPTPNRTKSTQEETPPNASDPTFKDTIAASVVSQKPAAPTLRVLDKDIVPEIENPVQAFARSYATSNRPYSKSRKTDSLSGHHDLNMQMTVENPAQALERSYDDPDLHTESKDEVKKQPPPPRAHHQTRVRRSKGKKEKLVEYNQKSRMDPNLVDDSKNELQKKQPPPSHASSRKSYSFSLEKSV